jgi:hypothetical protein
LPVTIPGRFWPPREAVDSVPDGADLLSSDDEAREQKTVSFLELEGMRMCDLGSRHDFCYEKDT